MFGFLDLLIDNLDFLVINSLMGYLDFVAIQVFMDFFIDYLNVYLTTLGKF